MRVPYLATLVGCAVKPVVAWGEPVRRLLYLLSPIPWPIWFMRLGGRLNALWLRLARGRGPLTSNVLVLTTRGRRSGRQRSTTLLDFERAGRHYVVASAAGARDLPAWYLNLVVDPSVRVEAGGITTRCLARVLGTVEATDLWPYLDELYPGFHHYRRRTSRPFPVVELVAEGTA